MEKRHAEIRQSLGEFAAKYGPMQTMLALATEVDEDANTCTLVDDDELQYFGVQLKCVLTNNEGETFYPVDNSYVLAARIEDSENWCVIAAEKFYKKRSAVETAAYELTADGHLIKKGATTLKGILTKMVEATQQIAVIYGNNPDYAKLTEALNDINDLLQ